jgi:hypothetical protein
MLALYHLCFGVSVKDLPGCETIFTETGIDNPPKDVKTAVLVGNKIDPGTPERKKDGTLELDAIALERDTFHGEWNYRIKPQIAT